MDPSNSFRNLRDLPNVKIIRQPVEVDPLLGPESVYIRNTSTDGDSLLVHEALANHSPVIASSCVSRPNGVLLMRYCNVSDLEKCFEELRHYKPKKLSNDVNNWKNFLHSLMSN